MHHQDGIMVSNHAADEQRARVLQHVLKFVTNYARQLSSNRNLVDHLTKPPAGWERWKVEYPLSLPAAAQVTIAVQPTDMDVEAMLRDEQAKERILACQGRDAQAHLEALQKVKVSAHVSLLFDSLGHRLLTRTARMSSCKRAVSTS
jgi:hypothetical protein